jgi:hypothetical protein
MKNFDMSSIKARFLLWVVVAVGVIGFGTYLAETLYFGPARRQQQLIANLQEIVSLLTKDIRIAEVFVLEQDPDLTRTTFRFVEVNEEGERIGEAKEFTINGDVAYFDTLVIKFEEPYQPLGDLPLEDELINQYLENKAIIFFRRVFGEKQKPEEGFPLDRPGGAPEIYGRASGRTSFEDLLWREFWQMATDPALARKRGVRAAHGQAVYTKLEKGTYYILERRLTGDLTIRPTELPAAVK